jgi:hypothetical protein
MLQLRGELDLASESLDVDGGSKVRREYFDDDFAPK